MAPQTNSAKPTLVVRSWLYNRMLSYPKRLTTAWCFVVLPRGSVVGVYIPCQRCHFIFLKVELVYIFFFFGMADDPGVRSIHSSHSIISNLKSF